MLSPNLTFAIFHSIVQVVLALLDNVFLVLSVLNNSLASVLHWPFSKSSELWVFSLSFKLFSTVCVSNCIHYWPVDAYSLWEDLSYLYCNVFLVFLFSIVGLQVLSTLALLKSQRTVNVFLVFSVPCFPYLR